MTTKEKIEVMKAYTEGKKIQFKPKNDDYWTGLNIAVEPLWAWDTNEYRVKPETKEPTYRPYKNLGEFKKDIEKRYNDDFNMVIQNKNICVKYNKTGGIYMISGFVDATFGIIINGGCHGFDMLFERYTYLDGTPFGVQE